MNPKPDLDNIFDYHAPDDYTRDIHQGLREQTKDFAARILALLPDSREKSLFLTNLEQASFWAHAATARHSSGGERR